MMYDTAELKIECLSLNKNYLHSDYVSKISSTFLFSPTSSHGWHRKVQVEPPQPVVVLVEGAALLHLGKG